MHINYLRTGTTTPTTLRLGATPVERVYLGDVLVYGEQNTQHSIYGGGSPGVVQVGNEGAPIVLAASFYREGATNGWRVVGGRLYVPAVAGLPSTVTMFYFYDSFGAAASLSTRTYAESKTIAITSGWNDVYWDTPYALGSYPAERVWVGYTFGNGQYLSITSELPFFIEASDGSPIKMPLPVDDPLRAAYAIDRGGYQDDYASQNPYGIDIIIDEGI